MIPPGSRLVLLLRLVLKALVVMIVRRLHRTFAKLARSGQAPLEQILLRFALPAAK